MLLQTPALAISTNASENEKKENKVLSFIKKNPIKTTCAGLLLLISPYIIYRHLNKSIKSEHQEQHDNIKNNDEDIEIDNIESNAIRSDNDIDNIESDAIESDNDHVIEYPKIGGFMITNPCDGLVQYVKSVAYDSHENEDNNETLTEICKNVLKHIRYSEYDEDEDENSYKNDLHSFVLVYDNLEILKENGKKVQYLCKAQVDSEGKSKAPENNLPKDAIKIFEFVEKLKDENEKELIDNNGNVKKITWSVYKNLLNEENDLTNEK